jgi:phosphoribosylformylglycinamidine synthase II
MPDSAVLPTVEDALALGLTRAEYEFVCERQGGAPNQVELAMYSLLWSEHCAYKHSKKLLRTLPTEGRYVVMGPGENAGAVDVGNGIVCAFKVESHNHPSAVEPFQGAATGVGGILRDIFAIGARPIAVLDSLRFGEVSGAHPSSRARYLLDGAVRGIGHYGNSIGVPTIGGEVYFEGPYEQNCLINAMALGLGEREKLVRSAAAGPGNTLLLFGARTGRDGIGGASVLASAELGEAGSDEDKRPTVQVGDPFEEKKLLECSLELLERGLIVALQDLGAAGLTSSAAEMASKGEVGIDLDVAKIPLREPDMEPFEVMVSESQERMLCVVEPQNVDAVIALCEKWEVNGHDDRSDEGVRRRRARRGYARQSASRRLPAVRPEAGAPDGADLCAAGSDVGRRHTAARGAAGAAGVPEHRLAQAAVRAVRRDRAVADGAPARAGGRRRAGD